ncbi:MAG: hypothetical protein LBC69_02715 [Eubacteriaceae bacterium]|jgi:hypothetical protein|nr:hypothetical protein [Eubacteriaceae bacterium]
MKMSNDPKEAKLEINWAQKDPVLKKIELLITINEGKTDESIIKKH